MQVHPLQKKVKLMHFSLVCKVLHTSITTNLIIQRWPEQRYHMECMVSEKFEKRNVTSSGRQFIVGMIIEKGEHEFKAKHKAYSSLIKWIAHFNCIIGNGYKLEEGCSRESMADICRVFKTCLLQAVPRKKVVLYERYFSWVVEQLERVLTE